MIEENPYFRLLDDPSTALLWVLPVVVLGGLAVTYLTARPGRSRGKFRKRRFVPSLVRPKTQPQRLDMRDPASQLTVISQVEFETVPLLNRAEARLLPVLESATRDFGDGHRLMAQTSLGEILRPRRGSATDQLEKDAYAAINSKRLDFAVFDRYGRLAIAIEYQGSGHFISGTAFLRDAAKKEAIRKSGAAWLEVPELFEPAEIRKLIESLLRPFKPAPTRPL